MTNIFSAIVVYVVIWWLVLFCTLPLDIKPITKTSDGSMPGAPVKHGMKRKAILTTAIATAPGVAANVCGAAKPGRVAPETVELTSTVTSPLE